MQRIASISTLILSCLVASPLGQFGPIRVYRDGPSGYLGVTIRDVNSDDVTHLELDREAGVFVEEVSSASPAAEAGIQPGDVLLSVSGLPILSARQFRRVISELPSGRRVEIELMRDGSRQSVSAKLSESGSGRLRLPDRELRGQILERARPFVFDSDRPLGEAFRLDRPRLGIQGQELTGQLADYFGVEGGVLIVEVQEETPAAKAGLKAGDVITQIDGSRVARLSDLIERLDRGSHRLGIVRDRKSQEVQVEIPDREGWSRRRNRVRM